MADPVKRPAEPSSPPRVPWPRWKILLCAGAGALVIGGLVAQLLGGGEPASLQGGGTGAPSGVAQSLIDGQPAPGQSQSQGADWSSGMLTMGFSFFVGFAVGTVLRAFVKMALLVIGLVCLAVLAGQHFGLLNVNMESVQQLWDGFVQRVQQDFGQLQTMVTGRLPQAGLGALGLVAGLKRR